MSDEFLSIFKMIGDSTQHYIVMLAIFAVLAYFIGCISPAIIISRLYGIDIKHMGSGNAGTTNVLRVLGWKAALVTLAVDIFKGFLSVQIALNALNMPAAAICSVTVILGHIFPIFFKFKGGKGVATAFGAVAAINWPSAFAALIVAALGAVISRRMSVGSIVAAIVYPLLTIFYIPRFSPFAAILGVIIILTHMPNIKRLIHGEEPSVALSKNKEGKTKVSFGGKDDVDRSVAPYEQKIINKDDSLNKDETEGKPDKPAPVSAEIIPDSALPNESADTLIDYYADAPVPKLKKNDKKKIAVIGNGSFGTSMANLIVHNGQDVMVWGRNKDAIEDMRESHQNKKYLPGILLSDKLKYTYHLMTAVNKRDFIIFAVPAQQFRKILKRAAHKIDKSTIIVNLAKGIEQKKLKRMSEIAAEELPGNPYVALSGPSHAEEIAMNYPATIVAASSDKAAAKAVQNLFMSMKLRVYTSDDIIGVELGGALKNVIAIGTGISDGMEFGDNTKAAIMTRGIHEISRLGTELGASENTFAGLSGIGDLMVTCSSNLSRNRRCGILIGKGMSPEEAVKKIGVTVEGFYTVDAAVRLAEQHSIEMPISEAVSNIIKGNMRPEEALNALMGRSKKDEMNAAAASKDYRKDRRGKKSEQN